MKNLEQLERAKNLAKQLLYLPISPSQQFGYLFIQHPFFESGALHDKDGLFMIDENYKSSERFQKYLLDFYNHRIKPAKTIKQLVGTVRKSYRLTYIYYLEKYHICTKKACGNLLLDQWIIIENFSTDVNVSKKDILSWLCVANHKKIMTKEEQNILQNLPEEVIVFRGTNDKAGKDGFSWTLNKEQAIWFATRFTQEGFVYQAIIPKDYIFAYTDARGEQEIILDYHYLKNVEQISIN